MQRKHESDMTPEELASQQALADHRARLKQYVVSQKPQDVSAGLYTLFSEQNRRLLLANYLDVKSLNALRLVDKKFHAAVNANNQEMLFKAAEKQLPQYVFNANWKMIEILVKRYPDLIFKKFKVNIFGQEMETSVLDFACYVRDSETLTICKKALRPDQEEQYVKVLRSYSYEDIAYLGFLLFNFMKRRWLANDAHAPVSIDDLREHLIQEAKSMSQINGTFCTAPFLWAGQTIVDLRLAFEAGNALVTEAKLDEYVNSIGSFANRYLLPRHVLRRMHAPDSILDFNFNPHVVLGEYGRLMEAQRVIFIEEQNRIAQMDDRPEVVTSEFNNPQL